MSTDPALPSLFHAFARPAAPRSHFVDIVAGNGAEVSDAAGNVYVDALGSLWYCNVGHGRAEIAEAVATQMGRLEVFHTFDRFTNPPADALADRLAALAPMPDARVFLTSGGSESVETAMKLARIAQVHAGHPERTVVVGRPSYHGVTYGALSVTGLPGDQEGFAPLLPDVVQIPYDDVDALDRLAEAAEGRIAAVIAEPVIGAGGVYPPPDGYLAALRERCDRLGRISSSTRSSADSGASAHGGGPSTSASDPTWSRSPKGSPRGTCPWAGSWSARRCARRWSPIPDSSSSTATPTAGIPCRPLPPWPTSTSSRGRVSSTGPRHRRVPGKRPRRPGRRGPRGGRPGHDGDLGPRPGSTSRCARASATPCRTRCIARPIGTAALAFCPPLVISDAQMELCVDGTVAPSMRW